jgi:DNA polymerase elongation subunit (family B)
MALTCDHRGEDEDKLTIRGVLLARRDNARWVRESYESVVRAIMAGASLPKLKDELNERIVALFRGGFPLKQFIISKTLGKDYTIRPPPTDDKKLAKRLTDLRIIPGEGWLEQYNQKSAPAHAQLAEKMKRRGCAIEPGSRLEYVIIRHVDAHARLFDRVEDPNYLCEHPDIIRIDPLYYAQNLINPIDQLLNIVFKEADILQKMVDVHCRFQRLMDHLLWRFHPYIFQEDDGREIPHPENLRFIRSEKKYSQRKKSKTTSTRRQRKDPSIVSLAQDYFS